MAALEEDIRALCAGSSTIRSGESSFDYVQDFGARCRRYVIAALLGVPPADREMVRGSIDESFHLDPEQGMFNDIVAAAHVSCRIHRRPARERQTNPRDDMFTDLREGEIVDDDGELRRLTLEQATIFARPDRQRGHRDGGPPDRLGGLVLADNPDQRAELVGRPRACIPNTVEELLRYEAPSPVQSRWCTADVELHGADDPGRLEGPPAHGSAGRDERAFPDADRFDIHRKIDHHVSFGYGIHFCLGAALARIEGRIALEETLKRFPEWAVDIDGAVPLHTSTVRGYTKLPISV